MKKKVSLDDINSKLDSILKNQARLEKEEELVHEEEKQELRELKELEAFEKKISEEVGEHPLRRLTYKDLSKGAIGAFLGVAAHYTFVYGIKVAADIDVVRATLLFPIAYCFGGVFMYFTGFRRIKDPKLAKFLPLRLTVLYVVALITAFLSLWLFNPEFMADNVLAYKQLATVTLSAVIGACTADLVGRD